jgi:DNA-3-methyladenine glycosylase I
MMFVREFEDGAVRCAWVSRDPLYIDYHDREWGTKLTGQNELFEKISLEGFQAGLSWLTILRRREGFRSAFEGFDVNRVADFTEQKVARLCEDSRIIRNKSKILAVIHNANLIRNAGIDLSSLLWSFARQQQPDSPKEFEWRATSVESNAMSAALKKLGFKYVGSTTMYALMQSTGMVQDHAPGCFRRP